MKNQVILVDVDDVVADLITPWLNWYNNTYVDNLKPEDITDWDISKFVKPRCGQHIYDFVNHPGTYKWFVKPVRGARRVINALRAKENRVIFVTAFNDGVKNGVKLDWLNWYGFKVMPFDYFEMNDKSMIAGDFLIDDGWHNIETSIATYPFLYTKPWNTKYDYNNRVSNWKEIAKLFNIKVGLW